MSSSRRSVVRWFVGEIEIIAAMVAGSAPVHGDVGAPPGEVHQEVVGIAAEGMPVANADVSDIT